MRPFELINSPALISIFEVHRIISVRGVNFRQWQNDDSSSTSITSMGIVRSVYFMLETNHLSLSLSLSLVCLFVSEKQTYFLLVTIFAARYSNDFGCRNASVVRWTTWAFNIFFANISAPDTLNVSNAMYVILFGSESKQFSANEKRRNDFIRRMANGMRVSPFFSNFNSTKLLSFTSLYGK